MKKIILLVMLAGLGCPAPRSSLTSLLPSDAGADAGARDAGVIPLPEVDAGVADAGQTTPPLSLAVGCWNLEWFGDPTNAPEDDPLQYSNVVAVLKSAPSIDIWGLEEVVSATEFNSLTSELSGFTGILATDAVDGTRYYSAAEQKPALLFRNSKVSLAGMPHLILTGNSSDFAGRPPLEVPLRIQENGRSEELTVIVLHMKAFADLDSYAERARASGELKSYLDATHVGERVLVIGDWNDDVDVSTVVPQASPYKNFVDDPTRYLFATAELSAAGKRSEVHYDVMIDHQLMTAPLVPAFVVGSAEVYDAASHIPDPKHYGATTSDHYPVITHFSFADGPLSPLTPPPVFINEVMPRETGASGDYSTEFVELVNGSDTAVSLSGWMLVTGNGTATFTFPGALTLQAGKALVVFNDTPGLPAGLANAISTAGHMKLYNTGSSISLFQADGGTADSLSFSAAQASQAGRSINRSPDGQAGGPWVFHDTLSAKPASPGVRVDGGSF